MYYLPITKKNIPCKQSINMPTGQYSQYADSPGGMPGERTERDVQRRAFIIRARET